MHHNRIIDDPIANLPMEMVAYLTTARKESLTQLMHRPVSQEEQIALIELVVAFNNSNAKLHRIQLHVMEYLRQLGFDIERMKNGIEVTIDTVKYGESNGASS